MTDLGELMADHEVMKVIRRQIHAFPELGYEEYQTAKTIAKQLTEFGLDVTTGIAGTGVVAILNGASPGPMIGLRADMDALPIVEANTFAHASSNSGKMHACGHDGHIAMLLGAARHLAKDTEFKGRVAFIFQPAEETGAGGKAMIKDGLFERFPVDAVFGMHNWPGMDVGHFGVAVGPMTASTNEFKITVKGEGSHAALPHNGRDAIFVAMQIGLALQGIVTRNKHPLDAAVLSITQIHAGSSTNVLPDDAWLSGTVRTLTESTLDLIERRLRVVASHIALSFECEAEVSFERRYPPTINSESETAFAISVLKELVGSDRVDTSIRPTMGAEDFSFMLNEKPGCYVFVGNGNGEHRTGGVGPGPCFLHNGSYDFNDDALPIGAAYWVSLARSFFKQAPTAAS